MFLVVKADDFAIAPTEAVSLAHSERGTNAGEDETNTIRVAVGVCEGSWPARWREPLPVLQCPPLVDVQVRTTCAPDSPRLAAE